MPSFSKASLSSATPNASRNFAIHSESSQNKGRGRGCRCARLQRPLPVTSSLRPTLWLCSKRRLPTPLHNRRGRRSHDPCRACTDHRDSHGFIITCVNRFCVDLTCLSIAKCCQWHLVASSLPVTPPKDSNQQVRFALPFLLLLHHENLPQFLYEMAALHYNSVE